MSTTTRATAAALATALGIATLAACGGSPAGTSPKTVTLVSHDSWAASKSVLKDFQKKTGYQVKVLKDGDAGQAVNKAILTKDNPQGDVFFGVDNTLLSRALDNHLFQPYTAKDLESVRPEYRAGTSGPGSSSGKHYVTPIDTGSICVNYDKKYFTEHHLTPPKTFADLTRPAYRNLLVTEDAAASSPGLGFLLGTVDQFGDGGASRSDAAGSGGGWQSYWKKLRTNGVKVVDTWEQAYDEEFSGSAGGKKAGGDRPLVVSYASSPPAEAVYTDPKPRTSPVGVATGTCFRQVEYAGLLTNARNAAGGRALLDFLISREFQQDMPLNMFVDPVREGAQAPALYRKYDVPVADPRTMAPGEIAAHRDQWVRTWTSLVVK